MDLLTVNLCVAFLLTLCVNNLPRLLERDVNQNYSECLFFLLCLSLPICIGSIPVFMIVAGLDRIPGKQAGAAL